MLSWSFGDVTRPGSGPVAVHGGARDSQHLRYRGSRQPTEELHFHDLSCRSSMRDSSSRAKVMKCARFCGSNRLASEQPEVGVVNQGRALEGLIRAVRTAFVAMRPAL
jgi:hypothetical protein